MTMPPLAEDPEASRPYFRRLRELAAEHGLPELSMGTSQDYRVAAEEGATLVRVGSSPVPAGKSSAPMGVGDVWNRALVYFGIVEDEEYWDEEAFDAEEELDRGYRERPNPNVRRLHQSRRRGPEFDDWSDPEDTQRTADAPPAVPAAAARTSRRSRRRRSASTSSCRAASTTRRRSRTSSRTPCPVILNLQSTDPELSKRLIDFSSGLTYALNGGMQRIADKVFLLTPRNVEVSAEERARLIERGFFNQS